MTPLDIISLLTFIICQGTGIGLIASGNPINGIFIMLMSSISGYLGVDALVEDLKK